MSKDDEETTGSDEETESEEETESTEETDESESDESESDESESDESESDEEASSSDESSDDAEPSEEPDEEEAPAPKPKKKKAKGAATAGAKRRKKKTATARSDEPRPAKPKPRPSPSRPVAPEDEETPWGLVVGAVLVAAACVAGLYWWNHRADAPDAGGEQTEVGGEAAPEAEAGDPFAAPPDVAAPPANAQRTASGLASRVLRPGTGTTHPAATDRVTVHYTGWTTDGEMFDSSHRRGQSTTFPLNRVIAGWTEGVQLMVEGERRRFWIPEQLAYQGRPGAPQGMLVFDVELLRIEH